MGQARSMLLNAQKGGLYCRDKINYFICKNRTNDEETQMSKKPDYYYNAYKI